jgi:hypothetical protein
MQVCELVHHISAGLPWERYALIGISVLFYEVQYYDILVQRFVRALFTLLGNTVYVTVFTLFWWLWNDIWISFWTLVSFRMYCHVVW